MRRGAFVLFGVAVLCAVTFGNPLEGNVLGFCALSDGPKAFAVDGIVGLIDAASLRLLARGVRG